MYSSLCSHIKKRILNSKHLLDGVTMVKQKEIFIAFFRSGILGFGGGPSTIPLVQKEVVETYKLMTDDEFSDVLAIGSMLPGPIITKMAGYIGYRAGGVIGMLNALIATVLPSSILMVLLLTVLQRYKNLDVIQGMTNGVVPVVAVMMLVLTLNFFKKGQKQLGWQRNVLILVAAAIAIVVLGIHPAIVIGVLLVLALGLPVKKEAQV